jgi:putative transposase
MSRTGNPYDNAKAERFMRTLKYEAVYLSDFQNLIEARASIRRFLEDVYNRKRLPSALGYRPPVEFELQCSQPSCLTLCLTTNFVLRVWYSEYKEQSSKF